jgi:hypothetical protein
MPKDKQNYREQPELECCLTCEHSYYPVKMNGEQLYCRKSDYSVSDTAICDYYEREG